jgi:hypothetical protein
MEYVLRDTVNSPIAIQKIVLLLDPTSLKLSAQEWLQSRLPKKYDLLRLDQCNALTLLAPVLNKRLPKKKLIPVRMHTA